MMSRVILEELQSVCVALLGGAVITLVYDLFRIFRRVIPHGNFWIGVEDFLFWIWASFWIFSILYRENDGSLRMYTMIAVVAGMVLYHRTISGPFVESFGKVLKIPIIFFGKKLKKVTHGIIMKLLGGSAHDKDET